MGMEQTVTFAGGVPAWEAVRKLLASRGLQLQMRMIDGQLAFPDEEPPESWNELRVATEAGMVTLRRGAGKVDVVVWGNADLKLRELWNALAWSFATAGEGKILQSKGSVDADTIAERIEKPPIV